MQKQKRITGVLHLGEFPKTHDPAVIGKICKLAQADLLALQDGGVDALIIENDFTGSPSPYGVFLDAAQKEMMREIVRFLQPSIRLPFGFCVLLNDYETAFELAACFGASFVRLDTFVDRVERVADDIRMEPDPLAIMTYKEKAGAADVELWADIHVKHAKLLDDRSIEDSARMALAAGADVLIVTGNWTGRAPDTSDIKRVRLALPQARLIIGSGMDVANIGAFAQHVDEFIIGSAFKREGRVDTVLVRNIVEIASINLE